LVSSHGYFHFILIPFDRYGSLIHERAEVVFDGDKSGQREGGAAGFGVMEILLTDIVVSTVQVKLAGSVVVAGAVLAFTSKVWLPSAREV